MNLNLNFEYAPHQSMPARPSGKCELGEDKGFGSSKDNMGNTARRKFEL
jgi:hypothetical protein